MRGGDEVAIPAERVMHAHRCCGEPCAPVCWGNIGFKWTRRAVPDGATIEKCGPVIYEGAACGQSLPSRADGVGGLVVAKVLTREGPIIPLGLVDDGMCGVICFSSTSQFSIGADP